MTIFTSKEIKAAVFLLVLVVIAFSCTRKSVEVSRKFVEEDVLQDSLEVAIIEEIKKPKPVIKYHVESISSKVQLDSLPFRYSKEERRIIYALNRIDPWSLKVGGKIIVPDSLTGELLVYSPFPEKLEILDSIPKAVLVSQRVQAFGLYEQGELIRWGAISSGKKSTPTPNGLHYGNFRARKKISTVNEDWLLPYYFNFMNFEGVGVHQYAMPGFPGSHACVRLFEEDAKFIYDWAEQWKLNKNGQEVLKNGTPFMVFGDYDYERPVPWLNLAENEKDNFLNEKEMEILKNYVTRYFQDEKNFRESEQETKPAI